jgi:hypothetical protein
MADILLNDPSGNPVLVGQEEAQRALASGYSQASEQQHAEFSKEAANQEKFGEGVVPAAKAVGLGALSAATFGLGTQALVRSKQITPDEYQQYETRNPVAYATGQVAGVVGSSLLLPGEGAVGAGTALRRGVGAAVESALPEATGLGTKLLQRVAPGAVGSAAEGALYGAGELINDQALGDPDLNAEKVMSTLGYSAAMGGGVGAILGPIEAAFAKKSVGKLATEAEVLSPEEIMATSRGEAPMGEAPTGIQDMASRLDKAKSLGIETPELPTKQILQDAESSIGDSVFPVHEVQLEAMHDPNTLEIYKAVKESNTPEGKIFRDYEAGQKYESLKKLNETVDSMSPEKLTGDAYKGGEEIVSSFKDLYNTAKKQDSEAFQVLKERAPNIKVAQSEVLDHVQKALPDIDLGKVFNTSEDGLLKMEKYKSSMPISKETYGALKSLVLAAKDGVMTVEELRNIRSNDIVNKMTFDMAAGVKREMGSLKKGLMDLMQSKVQSEVPDLQIREMFKRYAINEQNRELMEKVFGGKFDEQASLLRQVKPEELGDKVFRNSATIQVAKDILPAETFNRLVGNYLKEQVVKFTDKGTFSSQKFSSWLKNNQSVLEFAFAENPAVIKRFNALADKMRILPDSAPLNPSGTAKAIGLFDAVNKVSNMARSAGHLIQSPNKVVGGFLSALGDRMALKGQAAQLDRILAKSTDMERRVSKLATIERTIHQTTNSIQSLSKKALEYSGKVTNSLPGAVILLNNEEKEKKFNKIKARIEETNSPESYLDKMEKNTEHMYSAAPAITGSMQLAMTRATEFLRSKLPDTSQSAPLSPKFVASSGEITKFLKYYEAVENPLNILKQVRAGVLNKESMEAVQAVYPSLLKEMQSSVMDKITDKDHSKIPYINKVMLSFFLGQDLVNGVSSASILANQASFRAPSQKGEDIETANMQKSSSQKGLEALTLAKRSNTGTRAVIDRDRS